MGKVHSGTYICDGLRDAWWEQIAFDLLELSYSEFGLLLFQFSLDYLSDIIKPASKSNEISLHLGKDFPIKINFAIANGNGTIGYLLAPRIESD